MAAHVLIAEDEALILMWMEEVLQDAGYRVTVAANGVRAIKAYDADPADILVTDVRMPELDGLALVAHLRSINPNLPVIVMSGHLVASMMVTEPSSAPTSVFTKPVSSENLLKALRASLS